LDAITTSLTLLIIVVLSGMVGGFVPAVPRPLVQIAGGALAGLIPHLQIDLSPDVFFLLLVPPLLFVDGWHIPADELVGDRWTILHMALALVVATVLVTGGFIVWLVPGLPVGAAFALAAALAPTDPIAVTAIAKRLPVPRRMMNLLEAESLLNDATGLICLRFALVFLATGSFSLAHASMTFLWVACAGLATGFGVIWVIVRVKNWVVGRIGEEPGAQIAISLLAPFIAYQTAEALSASGFFAAVAAGVTMARAESTGAALGATRIQRSAVWDSVQFIANGVVFVLLGAQLPVLLMRARATVLETGHHSLWWLLMLITAVYATMLAVRMAWIWGSLVLSRHWRGIDATAAWRLIGATGLAGSRGAVSFAGILTLPMALASGSAFAERELVILIAMGVIILSLAAAATGLPLVLQSGLAPSPAEPSGEVAGRAAAAAAAVAEIARITALHAAPDREAELYTAAAAQAAQPYLQRLEAYDEHKDDTSGTYPKARVLRELQLAAVRAERRSVVQSRRQRAISATVARRMVRELDLLEAHYES
jgi:CPA1 family monovalent cation:H+ antiporter